ncbi:helix-turn-helix domain-containing protein [Acidobacteria bacterium AH-259-O06]|nr:helix-turn-helix domain-containing protein [Acidobacteria bacterium AH-259-O06]
MRTSPPSEQRLSLKEASGWFAAGWSFQEAMALLSDGAFKLFAYLCLQADRPRGRYTAPYKELAMSLGKSKRAMGGYIEELQQKGVCIISRGRNQYASSCFQITDDYWPYHRSQDAAPAMESTDGNPYISSIRKAFLSSRCSSGKFGPADMRTAKAFERRGVPLLVVLDAILVATCRKYISWLNGGMPATIGGLQYFESLIAEIQQQPLPEDYRQYLRLKNQQLAESWLLEAADPKTAPKRGYPDMGASEIVQ